MASKKEVRMKMSVEECVSLMGKIRKAVANQGNLGKFFQEVDKDGNGDLDQEEFCGVMRQRLLIGPDDATEEQIEELFRLLDSDDGGTLDMTEMANFMAGDEASTNASLENLYKEQQLKYQSRRCVFQQRARLSDFGGGMGTLGGGMGGTDKKEEEESNAKAARTQVLEGVQDFFAVELSARKHAVDDIWGLAMSVVDEGVRSAQKRQKYCADLEDQMDEFEIAWAKTVAEIKAEVDLLQNREFDHPILSHSLGENEMKSLFQRLHNPQLALLAGASERSSHLDSEVGLLHGMMAGDHRDRLKQDTRLSERLQHLHGHVSNMSTGCAAHLQRAKMKMMLARAVCAESPQLSSSPATLPIAEYSVEDSVPDSRRGHKSSLKSSQKGEKKKRHTPVE